MHLNTAHADLTDPSGYLVGTGNSSYSVMNTSSSTPATVVAEYYNTNGSPATSPQNLPSIPPLGRAAVALSSVPGLPSNWVGSIVLSADQDIVAAATTVYSGRNPVPDQFAPPSGNEAGAYEAFNTGSTTLFVPAIYRIPTANGQPARQASRYTIQNTTGSTANYTITYRSFAGVTIGTQTGTLQPYGWQTFRSWIDSEAPATNIAAFSAVINATQPLAGAAETLTNIGVPPILANWVGDYAMLTPNAATTVLYSPSAFRLCPNTLAAQANCANYSGINNFYTTFIQYSSFQLQNTTGNVANVTADFFYQPTGLISYTLNFTIAPFSSFGINLFNGGSLPLTHPIFPALGGRFFGSVRFTSDQPLVGVGNLDFPQTTVASYGSYNLVSDVDATNTVFAPVFVRICSASPCDQNNLQNFSRVSAIQVMNVGTVPVTLSSIDLITPTGSIALSLTTLPNGNPVTLAPGASVGLNMLNGGTWGNTYLVNNIVPAIGTNFQGSLRVTAPAGAKLKALVEWRDGNRGMDVFNAFNR
jgi:hypothetical protein